MRITHGNMMLRSLEKEHLELVRNWRNDQLVNEHLLNREYISQEAQQQWFQKARTDNCLYFIIEESKQPVGLLYASKISIEKRSFWGNVMMGNQLLKDSWASVKAVLLLCDFMLVHCNFKLIYSVVNKNNRPALAMNRRLGFIPYREADGLSYECCEFEN
ncbi:GNAT family N-acetyltransferase [Flavobacteriales bacterium]|nr:GNAT family N-acetyltransferase [Flavobacteriales bacterium]